MPVVDPRNAADIAKQIQDLLKIYTPAWKEFDPDTGRPEGVSAALIHTFARFAEIIIQRLNQVPEKNFLAYLDLLGASLMPPQPARVALTFSLSAGSGADARVPAETQVAAPATEDEKEPVIFETQRELWVTAMQLKSVYVRAPDDDKYADLSTIAVSESFSGFAIFKGNHQIHHILYIGHNTLFGFPELKKLVLTIELEKNLIDPDERTLQWEIWDGRKGTRLTPASDSTANLTKTGTVIFSNFSGIAQQSVNAQKSRWIRCVLLTPITPGTEGREGMVRADQLPSIDAITVQAAINRPNLPIETAFANILLVDLSKDFFPLGEKPKHGDSLYLANSEAFSRTGAQVSINITLTNPATGGNQPPIPRTKASADLQLKWEFGNGNDWTAIGVSTPTGGLNGFTDTTRALTVSGQVVFTFPPSPGEITVNDVNGYWIRVRIISGNYGEEAHYEPVATPQLLFRIGLEHRTELDNGNVSAALKKEFKEKGNIIISGEAAVAIQEAGSRWLLIDNKRVIYPIKKEGDHLNIYLQGDGFHLKPATFAPPSIKSAKAGYSLTKIESPELILTYNDFVYKEYADKPFAPFQKTKDISPSLYFGLTPLPAGGFSRNKISLYFRPADVWSTDVPDNPSPSASPRLVWEYWNSRRWMKITVLDNTESLTGPGLVEFLPPADFSSGTEFEIKDIYWLRVRRQEGDYKFEPKVRRIIPNTTVAAQSVTIRQETLGSGDGTENQKFRAGRRPILQGQQLEVREPEMPSADEQACIVREEGPDAVPPVPDTVERQKEIWVRWHEVSDFFGSGPRDRHYVLDHLSGDIIFGNGRNGLVTPLGSGNVRMARYQTGGGLAGNRPPGTIIQLKTTVPYVEKVTNTAAAVGGANAESLGSLLDRAPRSIRHRNRAVTLEDYEDLALLASTEVARAKCIPIRNLLDDPLDTGPKVPGMVSVIIVPRSNNAKPLPTLELNNRVQNYLEVNGPPTALVSVAGPLYMSVNVTLQIALTSLEGASAVEQAVYQKLDNFLHPLTGGLHGSGWAFGREPHKSDFYALIETVAGVDHIRTLQVEAIEDQTGVKNTGRFLVYSGTHQISMVFKEM